MGSKRSRPLLIAGALTALAAASAAAQTTSFAGSYNGAGTAGGACSMSYRIAGVEPSGPGPYPVFIYLVGTSESYDNAAAMAAVNDMAGKGHVAATVDYAASQFGACSVPGAKSSCVFNPNSALPEQPGRQLEHRHGELEQGRQPAVAHQLHDEIDDDVRLTQALVRRAGPD